MCKCWWCGGELVWQNDFTFADCFGETGDEEEDNKLVAILQCKECNAFVYYVEGEPSDE